MPFSIHSKSKLPKFTFTDKNQITQNVLANYIVNRIVYLRDESAGGADNLHICLANGIGGKHFESALISNTAHGNNIFLIRINTIILIIHLNTSGAWWCCG